MNTIQNINQKIQDNINNIARLIKEDKENQKKNVGEENGYKQFIYNILGKRIINGTLNSNNNYEYELTKDETQELMYNISIIHYLIEQKKLEIDNIKLVIDEDSIFLVKLQKETDDVFVVRKGCPSLKFKFPNEQLTNINKLIKKQKDIYTEINKLNAEIKNPSSAKQEGGGNNDFMNHLTKVETLTKDFNSPYQITKNSESIYNKLINYNNEVEKKFKKKIIEVKTPLEFSETNKKDIQDLIETLRDLSDLYYQYHKIFINLVLILKTLLQLNKKTYKEINDQIKDIQNKIFSENIVLEGGVEEVSISNDCIINVPNLEVVKEKIKKLKNKKIIIEVNKLQLDKQNKLKNILANTKDDFKINNGGQVKENNKILIL